ncbi:hypothetical protein QBC46DRAFT_400989 [Diplogelasinospora grovesii]|uniref:Uncharacterized protein n=1 Tax=Diplogelasinospora grovesii TaxID=303347 RepID=A0AAN6MUX5_9PEZI|nr:hypothetical protein QBC46DRAFT_400989 [Diplogelasinospora grovesii]
MSQTKDTTVSSFNELIKSKEDALAKTTLELEFLRRLLGVFNTFDTIATAKSTQEKVLKFKNYIVNNPENCRLIRKLDERGVQFCSVLSTEQQLRTNPPLSNPCYIEWISQLSPHLHSNEHIDHWLSPIKKGAGRTFGPIYSQIKQNTTLKRKADDAEVDETTDRPKKISGSDGKQCSRRETMKLTRPIGSRASSSPTAPLTTEASPISPDGLQQAEARHDLKDSATTSPVASSDPSRQLQSATVVGRKRHRSATPPVPREPISQGQPGIRPPGITPDANTRTLQSPPGVAINAAIQRTRFNSEQAQQELMNQGEAAQLTLVALLPFDALGDGQNNLAGLMRRLSVTSGPAEAIVALIRKLTGGIEFIQTEKQPDYYRTSPISAKFTNVHNGSISVSMEFHIIIRNEAKNLLPPDLPPNPPSSFTKQPSEIADFLEETGHVSTLHMPRKGCVTLTHLDHMGYEFHWADFITSSQYLKQKGHAGATLRRHISLVTNAAAKSSG